MVLDYFYGQLQTDIRMEPRASKDIDPYLSLDKTWILVRQQPIDGYNIYSRRNHELPMGGS
jgi:hypothetical protein